MLRGIGLLRLRVAWIPCFEAMELWEIRWLPDDDLGLYTASGVEPGGELVVGYSRADVPSAALAAVVQRVASFGLPLVGPTLDEGAIADGEDLEVCLTGSRSTCSVRWCQGLAPGPWRPLERIVTDVLAGFRSASVQPLS